MFTANMKKIFLLAFTTTFLWAVNAQIITPVKVEQLVKTYQASKGVTIVNFWSTWCKSCKEEIPHFIYVADSFKKEGVQLMLVSQDTKTIFRDGTLKNFLQKKGWKSKFYWLNETNADHYCPAVDSSWSGVIPVTLIINPAKNYKKFYEQELSKAALKEAIEKAL